MNIILLQDIDKVGNKHDIVKVRDGYGRNFLIPQGLAIVANDTNSRKLTEMKRQSDAKENKLVEEHKAIAAKLAAVTLHIGAKAGTSGRLFGSVTNVQLADAIKAQTGLDIERKKIVIPEEVKDLGTYTAIVNLSKLVSTNVNFEVVTE